MSVLRLGGPGRVSVIVLLLLYLPGGMALRPSGPVMADQRLGGSSLVPGDALLIQEALPPKSAALIFHVDEDQTVLSVIAASGVWEEHSIEITRPTLRDEVHRLRNATETLPVPGTGLEQHVAYRGLARDLYNLLLAPVADTLEEVDHLIIVPSDALFFVSFGALYACPDCEDRDLLTGQYAIERFAISYQASSSALVSPKETRICGLASLVVVGPELSDDSVSLSEAERVAGILPDSVLLTGEVWAGGELPSNVEGRSFRVVHWLSRWAPDVGFATGGTFPADAGSESQECRLLDSLINHLGAIGLAVISCSASREPSIEEGWRPWVEAMYGAGADAVLFPITGFLYTESAGHLMSWFYQGLIDHGLGPADALRQAQLQALKDPSLPYSHPVYWAPFGLYGDGVRENKDVSSSCIGKLDRQLESDLASWKAESLCHGDAPMQEVLITLTSTASEEDWETLQAFSDQIVLEGGFGAFILVKIPVSLLETLCEWARVNRISVRPGQL